MQGMEMSMHTRDLIPRLEELTGHLSSGTGHITQHHLAHNGLRLRKSSIQRTIEYQRCVSRYAAICPRRCIQGALGIHPRIEDGTRIGSTVRNRHRVDSSQRVCCCINAWLCVMISPGINPDFAIGPLCSIRRRTSIARRHHCGVNRRIRLHHT